MRLLLVATLILAVAGPASAGAEGAVTRWSGGEWTVWRIDRSSAEPGLATYDIRLRKGDAVTLDAAGCVAQALVRLPGQSAAVPLAGVLRRPVTIADAAGDGEPLRLGFGACPAGAEAHVFVALRREEAAPSPMDLVWGDSRDVNDVPLNPKWGLQVTEPGSLPNAAEICFSVPGYFDNPLCSTQHPATDTAVRFRGLICSIGAETPIAGHVNWYPSTYAGPIFWDSLSFFDRDYNMRLVPPEQNGLTVHNPERIKGEFDSRETINDFVTPWWRSFRIAGDRGKKSRIDGKPAIISGLMGIDCEHGCPSEVHPVWVLAIHVKDDPSDDVWAVFARNWGNEGFCSSLQHEVNWPNDRFTLTLPWREGATAVTQGAGTQFVANTDGISASWRDVPGEKVNLTFQLTEPAARGLVHGELHLSWTGTALAPPRPLAASVAFAAIEPQGGEAEALLEDLVARLPAPQRQALESRLARAATAPAAFPIALRRAAPEDEEENAAARSSVTSRPDPVHSMGEERRLRILLEAFGSDVPGPIGRALQREAPRR